MSFRVQKEIEGKKGRPIRVDVDPDGIINDVVEISLSLFKFNESSTLTVRCNGKILGENEMLKNFEKNSIFIVSEEEENSSNSSQPPSQLSPEQQQNVVNSLHKKVNNFYANSLPQGISLEIVSIIDNKISKIEKREFSSETDLLKSRAKENSQLKDFGLKVEGSAKFLSSNFSANAGLENTSSKKDNENMVSKIQSKEAIVSTICSLYVKKFKVKPALNETILETARKIVTAESNSDRYEALDSIIKTVKKINDNLESLPLVSFNCGGRFIIDAYAKSSETLKYSDLVKEAHRKTDAFASASFSAWKSEIDGSGHYNSGETSKDEYRMKSNEKYVSVNFKHESYPENCATESEIYEKLDQGPENWSITPDLTSRIDYVEHFDIIQMLKEHTTRNDDKTLKSAADFVEAYMNFHHHFIIFGQKHILIKALKQMNIKPQITPSNHLLCSENAVLSFLTIEECQQLKYHERCRSMYIFCDVPKSRTEDNIRGMKHVLDCMGKTPLNNICIHILTEADEKDQADKIKTLKKSVKETYGISNFLASDFRSFSSLVRDLIQLHGDKESLNEKRPYEDFMREKVNKTKI